MNEPPPTAPRRRPLPASTIVAGGVLGLVAAGAALLGAIALWAPRGAPELTEDRLAEAVTRWRAEGPADYDLDLELSGAQSGVYQAQVRGGKPVSLTLNGRRTSRRSWDAWTVNGLFDVLRHDQDHVLDAKGGFGAPAGSTVVLRAEFDPRFGYPARYERTVLGTPIHIQWRVTRFAPQPPGGS